MKTLSQLAVYFNQPSLRHQQNDAVNIQQLTMDSRCIAADDAFIALQGNVQHGLDYLASVLTKQPGLVISDRSLNQAEQNLLNEHNASARKACSIFVVDNLAEQLAELAHWFYDQPSQRLKVVGITGTNGKTSTAFYTAQLLQGLGQATALIGTLGNGLFGALKNTLNTTPDVISVHRLLAEFITQGAQWVVMEVSSHGLELGRIKCVEFESVALTQVSRDHMDFHGTEVAYQQAKTKLFTEYVAKHRILNLNDGVGQLLNQSGLEGVWRYVIQEKLKTDVTRDKSVAELICQTWALKPQGLSLSLKIAGMDLHPTEAFITAAQLKNIQLPLMGVFNIENILCAISILLASGLSFKSFAAILPKLQSVEGRMQVVSRSSKESANPSVIVDFAHTPDALEQVLHAVKQHLIEDVLVQSPTIKVTRPGQLWVVFGCGGNRDQGKRPLMAEIAERIADKVMVTDDNPRFENPQQITQQIFSGFKQPQNILQQADRKLAIEAVLVQASAEDIVVIAGKGHELYQDIQGVKTPFSDQQVVLDWLKATREQGAEKNSDER